MSNTTRPAKSQESIPVIELWGHLLVPLQGDGTGALAPRAARAAGPTVDRSRTVTPFSTAAPARFRELDALPVGFRQLVRRERGGRGATTGTGRGTRSATA